MFEGAIAKQTKQVLLKLTKLRLLRERFYLAGGTGLALQIGHRVSVDLDFFTENFPKVEVLLGMLTGAKIINQDKNSLDCIIDGVKVSFLEYKYSLLKKCNFYEKLKVASIEDILAMKMSAIMSRGSKKDFIDIFAVLKNFGLKDQIKFFKRKYVGVDYSMIHLKKSLVYFVDADSEPMPKVLSDINWNEVKKEIKKQVWGRMGP